MSNKVLIGNEAREKLLAGISLINSVVAPTLGANGRNAVFNKWSRVPIITNDGVSIAREVEPEDLGELQGANLLKQVSESTNDEVGDGTTTSIVLAHSIISQGVSLLKENPKINPMKLRREIKEATEKVLEELKKSATPVSTLIELESVASISVESEEIGKTIAKAIYDAGDNGIVYVNDSDKIGVEIEKVDGYQMQQGLITPFFVTNPERMETVLENPAILITEMPLHLNNDLKNLISDITKTTKDILIVCDELHPDVIKFAVLNLFPKNPQTGQMMPPNCKIAIVKKPMQANYLEDIAALTGGEVMSENKGRVKYKLDFLGKAEKIVINQKTTTIFGGDGKNKKLLRGDEMLSCYDSHIDAIKSQIESADNEIDKTKLQERLARLTGGVYMLNVGDKTEAESKYLRMKVDDAVNATKAAKVDGIVAGGGMALYNIIDTIDLGTNGAEIIVDACTAPLKQIIGNSGENADDIIAKIKTGTEGFNALTLEIEPDMIKAGIIDPAKVTRFALQNAASIAGLLLTTEVLITDIPEKKPAMQMPQMPPEY